MEQVDKTTRRYGKPGDDDSPWWRFNRTIRWYGLALLVGTKIADMVTTAVGLQYLPTIAEANPVADYLFVQWGLFTALTVLGVATIAFAAICAELFGLEIKRRFGLNNTALFAQGSIYLTLSVLFGVVAIQNSLLIATQVVNSLGGTIGLGG